MQRCQFDEIHYGSARLKGNDRGCILRPAIAIHGHFQRLKRRFPAITDHYLAHECVLRGAAITAWSAEVQRGTLGGGAMSGSGGVAAERIRSSAH